MDTPDIQNEDERPIAPSGIETAESGRIKVERLPVVGDIAGRVKSLFLIG